MRLVADMPSGRITPEMIESMQRRVGIDLRIEHSINIEEVTRMAVVRFVAGIGDINPLWTDPNRAVASAFGRPVAPPSFVLGCFSGVQFGWPGLGAFHASTRMRFRRPVHWGNVLRPTCTYAGFDGPKPSGFAGQIVIDRFVNRYENENAELLADAEWSVINFERAEARQRQSSDQACLELPHPWTADELEQIEGDVLAERPRGQEPRWWDDIDVGHQMSQLTKGPIGLTDEIAFIAGGGAPIPRLSAHAVALHEYAKHPAWAFRDPVTGASEPIYSVHYNVNAARAMGVQFQYDVGFQRQCWQIHQITHWAGDDAWLKEVSAEYRGFVYLSDVLRLTGTVVAKRLDDDGDHVVDIETKATNQRGENVMPGNATVALPARAERDVPAARRTGTRRRGSGLTFHTPS